VDREKKKKYVMYFLIAIFFLSLGLTISNFRCDKRVEYEVNLETDKLAKQLTEARWALLYDSDCEWSIRQLELFGASTSHLSMLDCDKISCWPFTNGTYPTWIKAGKYRGDILETHKGFKDIEELKSLIEGGSIEDESNIVGCGV
jgi:hypothetical protein